MYCIVFFVSWISLVHLRFRPLNKTKKYIFKSKIKTKTNKMETISIKPKQSVNLLLNNITNLKNPKLSITLDDEKFILNNDSKLSRDNLDLFTNPNNDEVSSISMDQCSSCESLKRMLYIRDRIIMKLAEDRDTVKIKLTQSMNMNVELSRRLLKYQNISNAQTQQKESRLAHQTQVGHKSNPNLTNISGGNNTMSTFYNEKIREELIDLRKKCSELEEINQHLQHHLYTLRNVFAELGNEVSYCELPSGSASNNSSVLDASPINKSHEPNLDHHHHHSNEQLPNETYFITDSNGGESFRKCSHKPNGSNVIFLDDDQEYEEEHSDGEIDELNHEHRINGYNESNCQTKSINNNNHHNVDVNRVISVQNEKEQIPRRANVNYCQQSDNHNSVQQANDDNDNDGQQSSTPETKLSSFEIWYNS